MQVCHSKLMRKNWYKRNTFQPKTRIRKLLQLLMLQCFLCFLFHFVGYSSAPCTMPVFSPDDVQVTTETQHETLDASSGFGKDAFKWISRDGGEEHKHRCISWIFSPPKEASKEKSFPWIFFFQKELSKEKWIQWFFSRLKHFVMVIITTIIITKIHLVCAVSYVCPIGGFLTSRETSGVVMLNIYTYKSLC